MSGSAQAAAAVGAGLQAVRKHGHAHGEAPHDHDHEHEHSHSHSHGGHGHSHGSIEASVKGRDLFACKLATAVGGATNVFFGVTKLYLGSSGGSVALMADGFHAMTDIAADIVSYFSISMSDKKLPRCRFPFGIGRLETSGAVIVAAILFFGGIALLIQSFAACLRDVGTFLASSAAGMATVSASLTSLAYKLGAPHNTTVNASLSSSADHDDHDHDDHHGHSHDHTSVHEDGHGHSHDAHGHSHFTLTERDSVTGQQVILWSMVLLAASSVVVKELLYQWTKRVGQRAGSRVVVANAYHHRADAWSGGVALLGVLGNFVGLPGIDGLAGCIVSLSICKIGYSLFKGSVLEFFDSQNVDDLAGVRAQLQEFHVSVSNGTVAMAVNNGGAATNTDPLAAAHAVTATTMAASAVDTKHVRFVNVFLMRHGHNYVLYVTFLAHVDVTAAQLASATDILTNLARKSLPVEMTYTSVQICRGETVPTAVYLHDSSSDPKESTDGGGEDDETRGSAPSGDSSCHAVCAATGDVVNPSLEVIINAHHLFHGSVVPLSYNWEKREMRVATEYCSDCLSDAESIASMFHLKVVPAPLSQAH